jgi:hypothetical protein
VRTALKAVKWSAIFGLELAIGIVILFAVRVFIATEFDAVPAGDIHLGGLAAPPRLEFASSSDTGQLQALFSQDVIDDLRQLRAGVGMAPDLSPGRAAAVRMLNDAGIPVSAWIALPVEQGYYLNASNAPQAAARYAEFAAWTKSLGLRWARIGFDIEPNLQEFAPIRNQGGWLHLAATLAERSFDPQGATRARNAYTELIRRIQADGYPVDTSQFPFIADERKAHSTLLERLFGIVDVHGDREALMTYSSFNHPIDSALVWEYGRDAQLVVVGTVPGLNWDEFFRDLLVAAHFAPVVGVFSLEGCIAQGFLPRLRGMDWSRSVIIPHEANRKVRLLRTRIQAALRTAGDLPYLTGFLVLLDAYLILRKR